MNTQVKGDDQETSDTIVLSLVVGSNTNTHSIYMYQLMWHGVSRNISPSTDISYSSGLNGSDPEQMSEWLSLRPSLNVIEAWNITLMKDLYTCKTYQAQKDIKATRKYLHVHISD